MVTFFVQLEEHWPSTMQIDNEIIQALQTESPNQLLKKLLSEEYSSKSQEELEVLEDQLLDKVDISTMRDDNLLFFEGDVDKFIKAYARLVLNACKELRFEMLKEMPSTLHGALNKMANESFANYVFTQQSMKDAIWLWKEGITFEQLEPIAEIAKAHIKTAFELARTEKEFWKRAFERQPDIQPISVELTTLHMGRKVDDELEKLGITVPTDDELKAIFQEEFVTVDNDDKFAAALIRQRLEALW